MKRRRFSMTKDDGEFVILALQHFIFQFENQNRENPSAYNDYMIIRAEKLKETLEEYEWEVNK